jgi:hypothetical protein
MLFFALMFICKVTPSNNTHQAVQLTAGYGSKSKGGLMFSAKTGPTAGRKVTRYALTPDIAI